ncbi:cytochrome P450 2D6-like [Lytechinus variegatus]|uniref:cytochrome P450 2D6-like n=1 Tax=Lytechinus variegatus TaxID=7654 RepID=UPI001BB1A916|nr:cytochrome P450 2D6-like [Lytechinus variegatus]
MSMFAEMISASYLATTAATFFIGYLLVKQLFGKRYRLPPGPKGWPFIGSYPTIVSGKYDQRELFGMWAEEYGNIYTFNVFGTRFVILNSHDLVQEAFQSPDINDRAPILPCNRALNRPNTGLGLISENEGPFWKEQRRFVISNLRNVRKSNNNFEDLVIAEAAKLVKEFASRKCVAFDPADSIFVTASNVVIGIVTGKTYDYNDEEFVELTKKARAIFEWMGPGSFFYHVPVLSYMPFEINKMGDVAAKGMFDFLDKILKRHRQSYDPADKPTDLIEDFLHEQAKRNAKNMDVGSFNDLCLKQVLWDLILGGFETVSTSILWYFLLMAQHPDIQANVQAELDKVVGRDRLPSLSDRNKLPHTESTMVECYRICRVLPTQIPHRTRCDVKLGGYDIPKGTNVATNAYMLASSAAVWSDPEKFVPDRFIDKESGLFDSKLEAKLMEFGSGRRVCPAEQLARTELFVFFTHILHRFTLKLPEGTPISMAGKCGLTFHPDPFKFEAVPRNSTIEEGAFL